MSEVDGIKLLVEAANHQPATITLPDGRTFAFIPRINGGYEMEEITADNSGPNNLPKNVEQHVRLQTVGSLVAYVERFMNDDSVIFADIANNKIVADIDYHKQPAEGAEPVARFNVHAATLVIPYSQEWMVWSAYSGKLMSHVDFATFIEENAQDVSNPVGTTLLEMCRDLQVKSGFNVNSSVRNGDVTAIEFQKGDDVTTKAGLSIPNSIELTIPVYFGEAAVKVNCFFRRKVIDNRLQLGFVMSRAENVRQDEFKRIVGYVESATELTTVFGSDRQ